MQLEGSVSTTSSAIWRFFQTPKGLLIIVLVILVAVAAPHEGIALVAPGLASGVLVASAIDVLILRKIRGAWEFPERRSSHRPDRRDDIDSTGALVRRRLHLSHSDCE